MYASYHNHTPLCRHASGSPREYIEAAIAGGIRIFGFSDHTPYFYDAGYYPPHTKMLPEELEEYVDTVLALKKEYAGDITIHLGLEAEYYPKYFDKLMDFCSAYPIEYFLLAQHNLGNEVREDGTLEPSSFHPTDSEEDLSRYVTQCLEAMDTGRFLYFAHPDVFHFTGPDAVYQKHMRQLCIHARERNLPLEINLQGIEEDRYYPHPVFWKMAAQEGNSVILGADAHRVDRVVDQDAIQKAEDMVRKLGLHLLEDMENVMGAGTV